MDGFFKDDAAGTNVLIRGPNRRMGVATTLLGTLRMRRIGPILVLIGLAGLARADGFIVIRDLPRPAPAMPLEVRTHHVSVHVKGRVAVTEVDQVFFNPGDARLEGRYLFPMPKGSQIDRFSMDVNGKMTAAELLDAAKARQIYEEIVRKARDRSHG